MVVEFPHDLELLFLAVESAVPAGPHELYVCYRGKSKYKIMIIGY